MRHTLLTLVMLLSCGPARVHAGVDDLQALVDGAEPGARLLVPAGRYEGPVRVEKPLTLVAEGEVVIDGGGDGDVIEVFAPDVTIRGFTIRNTGTSLDRENSGITVEAPRVTIQGNDLRDVLFGIYLREADGSVVRGNTIGSKPLDLARRGDGIRLWESPDCLVEDNVVEDSRDVVMWFSDDVTLRGNKVVRGRYGLHFMYSDRNVLEDNVLEHNSVGAFLMYSKDLTLRRNRFAHNRGPSGFGVGLKDLDGLLAEGNLFAANRIGVQLDNSPSEVDVTHVFRGNVFAFNDAGVAIMPSVKRNTFHDNSFVDNTEQVVILGRGDIEGNEFTVDGRGNYWSDYAGFDADEDGIGDVPYKAQSFFESLIDRRSALRVFLHSPAQQAIDTAARLAPIVKPRPKLVDEAPLMRPVRLAASTLGTRRAPGSMLLAGAILVAVGLGLAIVCVDTDALPRRSPRSRGAP